MRIRLALAQNRGLPSRNASVVVVLATSMCFEMYADVIRNMHRITPDLSQIPVKAHEASSRNRSR
jgi:hypothetical protein